MNNKVKVPKEVAAAIEELRSNGLSNWDILYKADGAIFSDPELTLKRWAFGRHGGTPDLLMSALINGYEVEKTPEEKLREFYENRRKSSEGVCVGRKLTRWK